MPSIELIQAPGEYALTGNSMKFAFQGNDIEGLSFSAAMIVVKILNPNTGDFETVSEETQSFGTNNIAEFYIQELFSDKRLNYLVSDMSNIVLDYVQYTVNYRMTWFDANNERKYTPYGFNLPVRYALPGGISREYEANFLEYNLIEDLLNSLANRWLSNHPPVKRIRKGQKDILSFLTADHAAQLKLVQKIKGAPETTLETFYASQNNKIVMRVIDFDGYFNSGIEEITIFLRHNDHNIAERTYFLEKKEAASVFYFRNSFGTMDSVVCDGNMIAEREIEGDIFQAGSVEKPSLASPDLVSERKKYDTKFSADIGYHNDKRFQDFITEMMISEDVWRSEGSLMFPVVVNVKKYSFIDEKNNNVLHAEIEWRRTFTEKYFTRDNEFDFKAEPHLIANGQKIAVTLSVGNITPVNLKIESSSPWTITKLGSETFYNFSAMSGPAGTTTIKLYGNGNVTGTAQFKITNTEGFTINGTVKKLGRITVDLLNPKMVNISGMPQTLTLNVNSDYPFSIVKTGDQSDWISVTPLSGGVNGVNITVTAAANIDTVRTAEYTVKNNYATCLLTIVQGVVVMYYLVDNQGNYLIDKQGNKLISY